MRYAGRPAHLPQLAAAQPRRPRRRGAGAAPGSSWPASQEILAQCHLDVADCLLRAGRPRRGRRRGWRSPRPSPGARWFHNKWRFDQRRGLLLARLAPGRAATPRRRSTLRSPWRPPPRSAATPATPCSAGWSGRPRRRGSASPSTSRRLTADLTPSAEVAALEGWWLAADVADATGSAQARTTADAAGRPRGARGGRARARRSATVAAARLRLDGPERQADGDRLDAPRGANRSPVAATASTASATKAARASALSVATNACRCGSARR